MAYAGIHSLRIMPHIAVWEFTFFLPKGLDGATPARYN